MPRIGRFLFGEWLRARGVEPVTRDGDRVAAAAGYKDLCDAEHHRRISLDAGELVCIDTLGGRFGKAVLRWRLTPADYRLEGATVRSAGLELAVSADGAAVEAKLSSAPESLYYQSRTEIPVLEVTCDHPATITTSLRFDAAALAGDTVA